MPSPPPPAPNSSDLGYVSMTDAPPMRLDSAAAHRFVTHHLGSHVAEERPHEQRPERSPQLVLPPSQTSPSQDGESLVKWLRVANGRDRVLCLACDSVELLQNAALILDVACAKLPGSLSRDTVMEQPLDPEGPEMTVAARIPRFQSEGHGMMLVLGHFEAVGFGINLMKRKRTARLALALHMLVKEPRFAGEVFASFPDFPSLQSLAWLASPGQDRDGETLTSMVSPAATTSVRSQSATSVLPAASTPSSMQNQATNARAPPAPGRSHLAQRARQMGYSEECCSDPFLQFKIDKNGGDRGWCAACNRGTDDAHINSKTHLKRLADVQNWLAWCRTQDDWEEPQDATSQALRPVRPSQPPQQPPPAPPRPSPASTIRLLQGQLPAAAARAAPEMQKPPPSRAEIERFWQPLRGRLGLKGALIDLDTLLLHGTAVDV